MRRLTFPSLPYQFRWLSRKYPKVCMPVVEEQAVVIPGKDGEPDETIVRLNPPPPVGIALVFGQSSRLRG